jgi:hypothetical protein
MSQTLIVITGLIYGWIAAEQSFKGNIAVGMMFAGYAFANIGIYMQAK